MGQQRNSTKENQQGAFTNIEKVSLDNPSLIKRFYAFFFYRPDLDTLDALKGYLARSSAFLAHQNVFEYSRSRAGIHWTALQEDENFLPALEVARWNAFLITNELVGEMVLNVLRKKTWADAQDIAGMIGQLLKEIVLEHQIVAQSGKPRWGEAVQKLPTKMRTEALGPSKKVADIAAPHVSKIFAMLPVHKRLRSHDELLLLNGLRLNLLQLQHEFSIRANHKVLSELARTYQVRSPDPDL
ncbi:hypothetical protein PsAD2_02454 [Pseudovibrio axinellae]|uniref:Uncharacterized protein n=1 Tax=Pseudovibrio axinellae TaxID=989403 RepID=A0A165YL11_9HYPH|nr:hypothetical protein [Pseudovibrio axinellae]KZL18938.1 hypothetical protein PsAD2_02454 [Pseudovibrio axinellae]SEP87013.1 hypothetical protein SAMN05421798_101587 [Pseudovibrio axinellae]